MCIGTSQMGESTQWKEEDRARAERWTEVGGMLGAWGKMAEDIGPGTEHQNESLIHPSH